MELEITPEPEEHERKAILAALAEEEDEGERSVESAWARAARPVHGDDEPPEP